MTEEKVEQIRNSQHWYKQIFPFRRYPMKIDPPIKAKWFYMFASEKIKFNWFCYEYACMLYDHIRKSERLKKWKSERSDLQVAEFCAYFAKRMKQSVIDKLNGLIVSSIIILHHNKI